MSGRDKTPFPYPQMEILGDARIQPPLQFARSGESTVTTGVNPLGAVRKAGRVVDVWLSVAASGKDDSNPLQISGDVFINGTTCLTTKPSITHVSGEASQQKTTKVTGDTGIAQAVINTSANTVAPGDILTCVFTVVRTATPTTEISNPVIVVEFEPVSATPQAY